MCIYTDEYTKKRTKYTIPCMCDKEDKNLANIWAIFNNNNIIGI